MKRNDFRQMVDQHLENVQWDERMSRAVLEKIDAREQPRTLPVRRKMSLAMALAVLMTLLAATALAVTLIRYSPRVSSENRARRLLMAEYGLTRETLGLFSSEVIQEGKETVVTFTPTMWEDDLTGVYTVRVRGNEATASWSHDDLDPALWQDGGFDAPVWGQPQLAAYLAEGVLHEGSAPYVRAHPRDHGEVDARPTPQVDEGGGAYWNGEMWLYEATERAESELTFEEAREITRAALMGMYDLSEGQAAAIDFFEAHLIEWDDGRHVWDVWGYLYLDGVDLSFYALIDARSGEVLQIGLGTGGNG